MTSKLNQEAANKAVARILKNRNCSATEILKGDVVKELSDSGITTSAGTSGPVIRTALQDAILAETLDIEKLSFALKAAFLRDRKNVVDDAVAGIRHQSQKEAQEHDQLCIEHAQLFKKWQELVETLNRERNDHLIRENEFAEARGKISTFDEAKASFDKQLENMRVELEEKRSEAEQLRSDHQRAEDLTSKLRDAEKQATVASQDLELTKQALETSEVRRKELIVEKETLTDQYCEFYREFLKAKDELKDTSDAKIKAEVLLEERSKQEPKVKTSPKASKKKSIKTETADNSGNTETNS